MRSALTRVPDGSISHRLLSNLLRRSVDLVPWWLRDRVRRAPLLARVQQRFFSRFLSGQEFEYEISAGPARGLVFPINLPRDKLFWTGTWEKQVAEVISKNIREGDVCLDIGSHRGLMAGIMALASRGTVYCFEPNPENHDHLERLRGLNPGLDLCLVNVAVSDSDGEAEFSIMPESSMGKLSESVFQSEAQQTGRITVPTRALDSLLNDKTIVLPEFLKIDVEGAELLVLKGAANLIADKRPTIVVELHSYSLAHECTDWLRSYRYGMRIIESGIDLDDREAFRVCHLLARAHD